MKAWVVECFGMRGHYAATTRGGAMAMAFVALRDLWGASWMDMRCLRAPCYDGFAACLLSPCAMDRLET